jgi:hypothetical protein
MGLNTESGGTTNDPKQCAGQFANLFITNWRDCEVIQIPKQAFIQY